MVVNDPLDFTPNFTMSTLQTSSEVANVIINSVLIALVLINIGSAVSKLVYITQPSRVRYSSWLRGFIFANSDDPLRILSWMTRKYIYRDPKYLRYPNRLRLKRLVLPLLSRGFILIASVASIAVTIPTDEVLDSCQNGDYRPVFDPTNANPNLPRQPICSDIPLRSNLGTPSASAGSCLCPISVGGLSLPLSTSAHVITNISATVEEIQIIVNIAGAGLGFHFYVEWRPEDRPDFTYRSKLSDTVSPRKLSEVVAGWFMDDHPDCEPNGEFVVEKLILKEFSCTVAVVNIESTIARLESRLRDAISFERTPEIVERTEVVKVGSSKDTTTFFPRSFCVVPILVTRPIVNMAPMTIILIIWVAINVIISLLSRRYDNALDAAFHLVKEALGHDSTSNPLEECRERKERKSLKLQNWVCASGGYHRGFLGRRGDIAVHEFPKMAVVSCCGVVRSEHETSSSLLTAPMGFAAPI